MSVVLLAGRIVYVLEASLLGQIERNPSAFKSGEVTNSKVKSSVKADRGQSKQLLRRGGRDLISRR